MKEHKTVFHGVGHRDGEDEEPVNLARCIAGRLVDAAKVGTIVGRH